MTERFKYTKEGYILARQFLNDIGYWEKAHMEDNGHTEQQAVDIANVWVEIGIKWHKEAFEKYIENNNTITKSMQKMDDAVLERNRKLKKSH